MDINNFTTSDKNSSQIIIQKHKQNLDDGRFHQILLRVYVWNISTFWGSEFFGFFYGAVVTFLLWPAGATGWGQQMPTGSTHWSIRSVMWWEWSWTLWWQWHRVGCCQSCVPFWTMSSTHSTTHWWNTGAHLVEDWFHQNLLQSATGSHSYLWYGELYSSSVTVWHFLWGIYANL